MISSANLSALISSQGSGPSTSFPPRRTVTVSAIARTSLILCSIRITVTPRSLSRRTRSNNLSAPSGDRTAVGSSRMRSLASETRARAISTPCWVSTGRSRIRCLAFTFTSSASRCGCQRFSRPVFEKRPPPSAPNCIASATVKDGGSAKL